MTQQLAAGIDIGGTNTRFGLVNKDGEILFHDNVPTESFSMPQDLVIAVAESIKNAKENFGKKYSLIGVGIGAPNGNYFSGNIEYAPNLKWKGIIPLTKYFSKQLNVKTILTNDANASALGELIFGGAKKMRDFIFITLGTGLGSGIVANGKLIYGSNGSAGELGHVIVHAGGRPCGCGRRGCLETYCSATGLKTTYMELLAKQSKEHTTIEKAIKSKHIFDKARKGDKTAIEAFRYTGDILGLALANSMVYTSPEAIFIAGGLAEAKNMIFDPVIESFNRNLWSIYKGKVKIVASKLKNNNAAILGASSLIWKK